MDAPHGVGKGMGGEGLGSQEPRQHPRGTGKVLMRGMIPFNPQGQAQIQQRGDSEGAERTGWVGGAADPQPQCLGISERSQGAGGPNSPLHRPHHGQRFGCPSLLCPHESNTWASNNEREDCCCCLSEMFLLE